MLERSSSENKVAELFHFKKPDECMEHSKAQFHTVLSTMNLEKHGVLVGEVLRTHESGTKSTIKSLQQLYNLEEETDAVLYHHS